MLPIGFAATHLVGFVMWWIVIVRYNFLVVVTGLTSVYSFSVTALAVFLPAGVLQMFLRRMMPVGVLAENECDLHSGFFGGPCCHRC